VAANCDVCGKGPSFGHSISHSHIRTKRRWNPNIQRVRALVAGAPKRLNVCTSCLKAGKVVRHVWAAPPHVDRARRDPIPAGSVVSGDGGDR
jgi:large subunit ribosomal protein L28